MWPYNWRFNWVLLVLLFLLWQDHKRLGESFSATMLLWFGVLFTLVMAWEIGGYHVLWVSIALPFVVAFRPAPKFVPAAEQKEVSATVAD